MSHPVDREAPQDRRLPSQAATDTGIVLVRPDAPAEDRILLRETEVQCD